MTELSKKTLNEIEKLRLLAFLPEVADMKPARKILSDQEAQDLISQMVQSGKPMQNSRNYIDLA